MDSSSISKGAILCLGSILAAASAGARADQTLRMPDPPAMPTITSGFYKTIPLTNWDVDAPSFIAQLKQTRSTTTKGTTTKAASDKATVYRPIPVCRLIDTRPALPAPAMNIPGPLAPGSTTLVNSAGVCGIPSNGVAGISLSFHVWNHTVNNGGYISFLQQSVPTTPTPPGVNAVFNEGATWTAATANISLPDDSGNFKIYIANSSVDVIVDVNGYYQDLDLLDVGAQGLDVQGNSAEDLFELTNFGSGSALTAGNFSANLAAPAFTITQGSVKAFGAGVDTSTFAFIHHVTATTICGGFPSYSAINHPMLNGDPNAIMLITPRYNGTGSEPAASVAIAIYQATNTCSNGIPGNRWFIRTPSQNLVSDSYYNVMVIKP